MCLAIPGQIIQIDPSTPQLAVIDSGGLRREVDITCLLTEQSASQLVGKWVIVHVGFALACIDEEAAKSSLALFAQLEPGLEEDAKQGKGEQ